MAKSKGLEAGAGAVQFTSINDLARGGTNSSSIAFRIIPLPSVPPKEVRKARQGHRPRRAFKACVCRGSPRAIPSIYNLFVENTRNVHVPPTVVGSSMSKTVVRVGVMPAPDVGQVASKERSESIYSDPNPLA